MTTVSPAARTVEANHRHLGLAPLFDPEEGVTIITPADTSKGNWVGAPSVTYDEVRRRYYLCYRVRQPRPIRGGELRIAESTDGVNFTDIWTCTKEELDSASIERAALVKTPEGGYRLYFSYVDAADSRWRIDLVEADEPSGFDTSTRRAVLTADQADAEGVKDPWVVILGGLYYMTVSYAPRPAATASSEAMHGTQDVFNTGIAKSSTGLAVSSNGIDFEWHGELFPPSESGWDSYACRIGSILYLPPVFTAFYDGSDTVEDNYEERVGIAVTTDLKNFTRLTTDGPALVSPHSSGSLRYLDAVPIGDEVLYYYEYARADGSHELRMNRVSLAGTP